MAVDKDVIVIGAGFAGLYAVHKLRDELGLDVQAFDAGGGPGGTWWWNRYPGARCDFESVHYSYSFSDEIQKEWEWTERFAAQPEILSYLDWVADRLDIKRSFQFDTRVTSIVWSDAERLWTVGTDDGAFLTARYVVTGVGNVSIPKTPEFTGLENFEGRLLQTCAWPHEPVDFTGKRVGVIGTGSTGLQVITEVAKQAEHLTVFQRTPQFAAPLVNHVVEPEQRRWLAENHEQVRAGSRETFLGAPYEQARPSALADSEEERRKVYDKYYGTGGFRLLVSTYGDLLFNEEANATIADYLRNKIRERVRDPKTAELLCPTDHPYGAKRAPFETEYFETYNRGNVDLVDVKSAPIETLTAGGLRTTDSEYDLDIIILATGFDVFTRPLIQMGIVGRDGLKLEDKWADGPAAYLGIQVNGFPNLFTLTGPQSAVALFNNALAIEDHVAWTGEAIRNLRESGATTMEPTLEAERTWGELTARMLDMTLLPKADKSWYMGGNIPGKPRAAYIFPGGAPLYRAITGQIAERGYSGFAIDGVAEPISPLVKLDPAMAVLMSGMLTPSYKPLELLTIDEYRETVESMTALQFPGPDMRIEHVEDPHARIYMPGDADDADRPVIVYYHGGGFVSGSLDWVDNICRKLAAENDAVVVSAGYRLAPENLYPAAHDDSFAALEWVHDNVSQYGGNPNQIVVMGESAGAGLAASVAIKARDAGIQLAGQILVYPPTDPRAKNNSRIEFVDGPFLSTAAINGSWDAYLGASKEVPQEVQLLRADLHGLPPAFVLSVELDPVRDEAEDYATALSDAGVVVEQQRFAGLIHGSFTMTGAIPEVNEMYRAITEFMAQIASTSTVAG
nr:alpha/beta hydrolase fold domain-containing protein [Rhodococcus sp. (in: high G+C Gram-positive bacteria)]